MWNTRFHSAVPGGFDEMLNVQAGDQAPHVTTVGIVWNEKSHENMDADAAENFLGLVVSQGARRLPP